MEEVHRINFEEALFDLERMPHSRAFDQARENSYSFLSGITEYLVAIGSTQQSGGKLRHTYIDEGALGSSARAHVDGLVDQFFTRRLLIDDDASCTSETSPSPRLRRSSLDRNSHQGDAGGPFGLEAVPGAISTLLSGLLPLTEVCESKLARDYLGDACVEWQQQKDVRERRVRKAEAMAKSKVKGRVFELKANQTVPDQGQLKKKKAEEGTLAHANREGRQCRMQSSSESRQRPSPEQRNQSRETEQGQQRRLQQSSCRQIPHHEPFRGQPRPPYQPSHLQAPLSRHVSHHQPPQDQSRSRLQPRPLQPNDVHQPPHQRQRRHPNQLAHECQVLPSAQASVEPPPGKSPDRKFGFITASDQAKIEDARREERLRGLDARNGGGGSRRGRRVGEGRDFGYQSRPVRGPHSYNGNRAPYDEKPSNSFSGPIRRQGNGHEGALGNGGNGVANRTGYSNGSYGNQSQPQAQSQHQRSLGVRKKRKFCPPRQAEGNNGRSKFNYGASNGRSSSKRVGPPHKRRMKGGWDGGPGGAIRAALEANNDMYEDQGNSGKGSSRNTYGASSSSSSSSCRRPGLSGRRNKNPPKGPNGAGRQQGSWRQASEVNGDGSEAEDERLRGLDPVLIERIENEIMHRGQLVSFDDIAGLESAKKTVREMIVLPILRPDLFTGLRALPKGLLMFGPPGTGKTLIGKAIASQCGATFFSISASSLTSKWVGEGEKMVRALFGVAAIRAPSVIFIDEIDSLLTQRSSDENESSRRIKTEFLVQLDGAGTKADEKIVIVGATNRPQELDEAARRRFVKRLYIPLPDAFARGALIRTLLRSNRHVVSDKEMDDLVERCKGYSGADIRGLCQEASMGPVRDQVQFLDTITSDQLRAISYKDFLAAFSQVRASVATSDLKDYIKWNKEFGSYTAEESTLLPSSSAPPSSSSTSPSRKEEQTRETSVVLHGDADAGRNSKDSAS